MALLALAFHAMQRYNPSNMNRAKQQKIAVAYVSASTVDAARQRCEAVRAKAAILNVKLVLEFIDCGYKTSKRPGLAKLVDYISSNEVDYVIAAGSDHFGYDGAKAAKTIEAIERTGAQVVFTDASRRDVDELLKIAKEFA